MPTFATTAVEKNHAAIARSHYESFNSRDFSRTLQNISESVEYLNLPSNITHKGHQGVRDFLQGWASAFPDSQVQIVNVVASGNMAVTEGRFQGTHKGLLRSPAGELQATDNRVDVQFCETMEIQDNKVQRIRCYFDWSTLIGQLGSALQKRAPGAGLAPDDPAQLSPGIYKILFENDRVRVLDVHLPAGGQSPAHTHPGPMVAYSMSDCKVRFTHADGSVQELEMRKGDCQFLESLHHAVVNTGSNECHVLNVELKS